MASAIFARRRNREKQESVEGDGQDLAARPAAPEPQYSQALVKMDALGVIRRVNHAAVRLFGYEEADLVGESILRLLPAASKEAAANRRGPREMEVHRKDHSTVRVRMTEIASQSEDGSNVYMFFEAAGSEGQPGDAQPHGAAASG